VVRAPAKLRDRSWSGHPHLEVVQGDLSDPAAMRQQLEGCAFGYYLIHSMVAAGPKYAQRDHEMASRFAAGAEQAGLKRIIYLGGLGELGEGLSEHLKSRREVEAALASGRTPLTVLRAAMIIGAGSVSFEILRYLVERLPVMITPRWVSTECQPIGIDNVLGYLLACLHVPATVGRVLDIGGADVMSYRQIMEIMAELRQLPRRWIIPVPVLTPRLSSLWIHLVTPLDRRIARALAEGLKYRVVCRNDDAVRLMPQRLLSVREAITAALAKLDGSDVETIWSGAGEVAGDPDWSGGTVFVDRRTVEVAADQRRVFTAVCRVGGGHGWYAADWLWRVRGAMDRAVGGPGLRRGRRDPHRVCFGEALDFWRVIAVEPGRLLRLRAEMKLPGEAVLEFEVHPCGNDGDSTRSRLTQTARFRPKGLLGLMYWYVVLPLHGIVFKGMLRGIRRAAEERA
jgi:uncharacterized protein YbjT (DUF2867 family)